MPGPNSADTERGAAAAADSGNGDGKEGEFAAIERLAARLASTLPGPPPGQVWIGDDTAVLDVPRGHLLLTTDLTVEAVHADLSLMSVQDMGWRALVASMSDVAAMGGRPLHAVVAVAGPPGADLDGLYQGLAEAAAEFACPVVGGDLSGSDRLVVAVAVTGEVAGGPGPVLRAGAGPGDDIVVTGPLGAAAAGLRQLRGSPAADGPLVRAFRRPRPRVAEGELARRAGASAMVDVSDGVLADLGRLADASGVGFELDDVPVTDGAETDDALGGGEDYELVVTTPDAARLGAAFTRAGLRAPVHIGVCVGDPQRRTWRGEAAPRLGWEHRFDSRRADSASTRHRPGK